MKLNKIFLSLVAGAAILGGASSCTEEVDYTPTAPAELTPVYFPTTNDTQIDIIDGQTSFPLSVYRLETEGEKTYNLEMSVEPASTAFAAPSSVTFKDGEDHVTFDVTFDLNAIEQNKNYDVTLTLPGIASTPYALGSITAKCLYLPWTKLGKGYLRHMLFSAAGLEVPVEYEVEYEAHPTTEGIVRIVEPFAPGVWPLAAEMGGYDSSKKHYMEIDIRNPEKVNIKECESGYFNGGTPIMVNSYSNFALSQGNSDAAITQNLLWANLNEGNITFNAESSALDQLMILAIGEDLYKANFGNYFRAVLPGYEPISEWEKIGMCEYTDGLCGPFVDKANNTYTVLVEKHTVTEGLYRMVNPFGAASGYVDADPLTPEYVLLDATTPECVILGTQFISTPFTHKTRGTLEISTLSNQELTQGTTKEDLIEAEMGGRLENGVITIPGAEIIGKYSNRGKWEPQPEACDMVLKLTPIEAEETPAAIALPKTIRFDKRHAIKALK